MKKLYYLLITLSLGCKPAKKADVVKISLTNNHRSLQIKGFDYLVMQEIARDSVKDIWLSLVPVYRMPGDTDMKNYQPEQPGKYAIIDSAVVFTPDTPFIKGQVYFLRNYHLGQGATLADYIKGRMQPGKTQFTDLIFKQ